MLRTRVMPALLLKDSRLVKTVKFARPRYIGDPINAVKIFNDLGVDELVLLDISATVSGRAPDLDLLKKIAREAFMPFAYGGGVQDLEVGRRVARAGAEKIVLNTAAIEDPTLIGRLSDLLGSQSVVVSIDCKRRRFSRGHRVLTRSGTRRSGYDALEFAKVAERFGAGELIINSIDRDGTMDGYDLDLIERIAPAVDIPVTALGGAGCLEHLADAVRSGAHAVAAGSLFVYHGPKHAVLISYPKESDLKNLFQMDHGEKEST